MGLGQSKNTGAAVTGSWTDFSTGEHSWVVEAYFGYVLVAAMGVWLSFTARYIKALSANLALWVHLKWNKPRRTLPRRNRDGSDTESSALVERGPRPMSRRARELAKIYKDKTGVRDLSRGLYDKRKDLGLPYGFLLSLFIFWQSVLTLGLIIGGIWSARIKVDGVANLKSDSCGLWQYNASMGDEDAAAHAMLLDLEKETRAAQYARACYDENGIFNAGACDFFYRPRLKFSGPEYKRYCPFDNNICRMNLTVIYTTEMTDASEIGINSKASPKFRRTTQCTPLSMEPPFIEERIENRTKAYYYFYGERPGRSPPLNYTYKTVGDPFERLAPIYDVKIHQTDRNPKLAYWTPVKELTYPKNSSLTLVFVSSLRIFYKERSDDPIFPADESISLDEEGSYYRNSDFRARPFACINSIEVCLADGKKCWSLVGDYPEPTLAYPREFWFMYASLLSTDIYDVFRKRLGRALKAQDLVSDYFSEALGKEHWVHETTNLVATAHARMQWNAYNIASGEDKVHEGKDGFDLITRPEDYGSFCNLFKYRPQNYVNIHFAASLIIVISLPVLFVLSLECWNEIKSACTSAAKSSLQYVKDARNQVAVWRARRGQNDNQQRGSDGQDNSRGGSGNRSNDGQNGGNEQDTSSHGNGQDNNSSQQEESSGRRDDQQTPQTAHQSALNTQTSQENPGDPSDTPATESAGPSTDQPSSATDRRADDGLQMQRAESSEQAVQRSSRPSTLTPSEMQPPERAPLGAPSPGYGTVANTEGEVEHEGEEVKWEPPILYGLIWLALWTIFWLLPLLVWKIFSMLIHLITRASCCCRSRGQSRQR